MALIECPQCKKRISDSAKVCVHCGYDLAKARRLEQEKREFNRLPENEQQALQNEFYSQFPNYEKTQKSINKYNLISRIIYIGWFIFALIFIILQIAHKAFKVDFQGDALMALAIVDGIILFVLSFFLIPVRILWRKYQRKFLTYIKGFQEWLLQVKQITYKVILDKKQMKIFESIDLTKEGVK